MVSLLERRLKRIVAKAFKGKLTKGTLRRPGATAVDDNGDEIPGQAATYAIGECIRESFSAYYRAQAGIPETDISVLVLLGTVSTPPRKDDQIFLKTPWNKWHQVRKILEVDPAGASAKYQVYEIPDPT